MSHTPKPPSWPFTINWDHPLMQDVHMMFIAADNGTMIDMFSGDLGEVEANSNVGNAGNGFDAPELIVDGSSSSSGCGFTRYDDNADTAIDLDGPHTVAWISHCEGFSTTQYQCLFAIDDDVGFRNLSALYSNQGGYSDITFGHPSNGDFYWSAPSGVSMTERHWGVYTFNGGARETSSNHQPYLNGLPMTSPTDNSLINTDPMTHIGAYRSSSDVTSYPWHGSIFCVLAARREWTAREARMWYDPQTRWDWIIQDDFAGMFVPAAGPGPSLPPGMLNNREALGGLQINGGMLA